MGALVIVFNGLSLLGCIAAVALILYTIYAAPSEDNDG